MTRLFSKLIPAICSAAILAAGFVPGVHAQATKAASGLPLPRFVTLKAKKINLRVGPGQDYAVSWLYVKSGLPVEIVQEFDTWRKIRDSDGSEGWVNQSLLSGQRTGIVAPWQQGKDAQLRLLAEPRKKASSVAVVEPGVIGTIRSCNGEWCEMQFSGRNGWIEQNLVWGAYPGETIKD